MRMKSVIKIFGTLLLLVVFVGCVKVREVRRAEEFFKQIDYSKKKKVETKGFLSEVPDEWHIKVSENKVDAQSPDKEARMIINYQEFPKESNLNNIVQSSLLKREKKGRNKVKVISQEPLVVSGFESIKVMFLQKIMGIDTKFLQYYVFVEGKRAYILTGSSPHSEFYFYEEVFEDVRESMIFN